MPFSGAIGYKISFFDTTITYRYVLFLSTRKKSLDPSFSLYQKENSFWSPNEVIAQPTEKVRGHFHARAMNTTGLPQNSTNT